MDRSPSDLALTADGNWAVTVNRTAGTASLVDLTTGKVASEVRVGADPFAVALTPDGKRAIVSGYESGMLTVLTVGAGSLKTERTVAVGEGPRGVCVSPNGRQVFVALADENAIVTVDLATGKVLRRASVPADPWHLALTPDGKQLLVACSKARQVAVLDAANLTSLRTIRTLARNLRHVAVAPDASWAYVPGVAERGMGTTRANIDRGWVIGNRLNRVPLSGDGPRESLTLDTQGNAVADVDGCAVSPNGEIIALTAGGTHELLLLSGNDLPFVSYGGSGDHLNPVLQTNPARFRRVPLGGRPLSVRWLPDAKRVAVANYLLNAVQIVDTASGAITATIPLGGPATPTLARQGEAIFTDGRRSFGSWYSCASCHVEGGENGGSYDTFNDGGIGKVKKTPPLRGVTETTPYTWHGWQTSLRGAIRESMEKSMQGPVPTDADVEAVEAYLKALKWRGGKSLTDAAKRGKAVFADKACAACHSGPNLAGSGVVEAGLEEADDKYRGYNAPPLRGVRFRAPYLHDGRADTLEEVLTRWHRPSQVTGKPDCTPAELADLVAYLKSL